MKLKMPASVDIIIDSLQANGYEAYAVGGCVRDSILGRDPDDWDITTSATPWEVKAVFGRTVDTGLQHGTVTVLLGNHAHEVTTYRIDGDYEDGRHPKDVTFTASLEEDLKRRDFTINAMAYNDKSGLIDLYGGVDDIQRGCIRCVGNAEERRTPFGFCGPFGFPLSLDLGSSRIPMMQSANLRRPLRKSVQSGLQRNLQNFYYRNVRNIYSIFMRRE